VAIGVRCTCGQSYQLKDELAGKLVKCPACGAELRVTAPERRPQADTAFDRDKFLLRQKHLAIDEKYYVWDEEGRMLLFVERPVFLLRAILALLVAVVAAVVFLIAAIALVTVLDPESKVLVLVVGISLVVCGGFAALALWTLMMPKRHVSFYRDDSRQERLLEILQDKKFWLWKATYSVRDAAGIPLANLHKNYLYSIFRKRWDCITPDGATVCVAREDSLILSLLRRFIGPLFGVLRTNFVIMAADTDRVIGEFNRNFTILDKYVLNLNHDPQRTLDRRIALALGVMLDTGEKR